MLEKLSKITPNPKQRNVFELFISIQFSHIVLDKLEGFVQDVRARVLNSEL